MKLRNALILIILAGGTAWANEIACDPITQKPHYNTSLGSWECKTDQAGGGGVWANEEGPAGQINGVNMTFTVANAPTPATSLRLVLNGLTLRSGADNDFTLSGNTITFAYPPTAGSNLICWYQH